MAAEISIEGLPEARARLAAMGRQEVERGCLEALMDAGVLAAGILELAHSMSEARTFSRNGDFKLAGQQLDRALSQLGNLPGVTP